MATVPWYALLNAGVWKDAATIRGFLHSRMMSIVTTNIFRDINNVHVKIIKVVKSLWTSQKSQLTKPQFVMHTAHPKSLTHVYGNPYRVLVPNVLNYFRFLVNVESHVVFGGFETIQNLLPHKLLHNKT